MSDLVPPLLPPFRVTLFFGPEAMEENPETLQCVFNVKKRSWKAGIQVAVHLTTSLVNDLRTRCDFEPWLTSVLANLAEAERSDARVRAEELLIVELARHKLEAALDRGVPQEHHALPVGTCEDHLPTLVGRDARAITARIGTDLDLPVH